MVNSLVEGLNKYTQLPRYIFMIPDKDVITSCLRDFDFGVNKILDDFLSYMFRQINKVIERRRIDLMYKRPGALPSSFEPRIIWVTMINRPFDDMINSDQEMRVCMTKFNSCLNDLIRRERYMYVMNLQKFQHQDAANLFERNNPLKLTKEGKLQFWQEIDFLLRKFENQEIDLKPVSKKQPFKGNDKYKESNWGSKKY